MARLHQWERQESRGWFEEMGGHEHCMIETPAVPAPEQHPPLLSPQQRQRLAPHQGSRETASR